MRLPNGFGQITKIKNKPLRKPFRAMVTVEKTDDGKYKQKTVGYYKTYNDAYGALVEYHKNPYDLDNNMSVEELYNKWSKKYFNTIAGSSIRTITSAWKYCEPLYSIKVRDLRSYHIKNIIESETPKSISPRIKSVFNLMLDYAVEYEIVDNNVARNFSVEKNIGEEKVTHIAFTDNELNVLWNHSDEYWVKVILLQCYMGWRPQELGLLKINNVKEGFCYGGLKTKAGKNRPVPIHSYITNIIQELTDTANKLNSEYLINCTDANTSRSSNFLSYDKYRQRFRKIMSKYGMQHKAHDPRKTFITLCKEYNVNEYAIKYMVGHSIIDITEKVYTERDISWLKDEIEKIKIE